MIDLTNATTISRGSTERFSKRQKLDAGTGSKTPIAQDRKFAGTLKRSAEQAVWKDVAEKPFPLEGTGQIASKSSSEYGKGPSKPMAAFPDRPDMSNGSATASRLSTSISTTRGEVQVKPYVLDIPSTAPRYQGNGISYSVVDVGT